jgi:CubicO group peptidase (beta-lactamase class C family)
MVWSCTKGMTAMCLHALVAEGLVELDAPVARWWPAFAQNGKREITVAMLLDHQAGLPGLAEPLAPGAVLDWDVPVGRLERAAPMWEPGTRHGYHSVTFGWLVGELIRRACGVDPGTFLREQIAGPLGADAWIGLPEREDHRVAHVTMAPRDPAAAEQSPYAAAMLRGEPLQLSVKHSIGEFNAAGVCNTRAGRAAQLPAANGIASARGLAGLYRPLATGEPLGNVELPAHVRRRIGSVESAGLDAVALLPTRFTSGFQKGSLHPGPWDVVRMPEEAFGHSGMGGSIGFADPARRLSFGYVTNRHAPSDEPERFQSLIDATYACVDPAAQTPGPAAHEQVVR